MYLLFVTKWSLRSPSGFSILKVVTDEYEECRWYIQICWLQRRASHCIVTSASVPLGPAPGWTTLIREVFFKVTVGGAPLSALGRVGQPFPVCVFLTARTVWAAQVGQAPGGRPLLRFHCDAAMGLLAAGVMEVVSQVLQVEGPGAELLPVDPLKGHDAVQVAT